MTRKTKMEENPQGQNQKTLFTAQAFQAGLKRHCSLKEGGQTLLTESAKANALNDQFQSVFSPKTPISLKFLAQKSLQDLHGSGVNPPFQPYPKMPDISITADGIAKLLVDLNPRKAAGPDKSNNKQTNKQIYSAVKQYTLLLPYIINI